MAGVSTSAEDGFQAQRGQSSLRNNGTFHWTVNHDTMLLREVRITEPYLNKVGSKEAGQAWKEVADKLNACEGFVHMPRDQRSVRKRYNKLMTEFKAKMRREAAESGTSPEPLDENGVLLQEINDIMVFVQHEKSDKENKKKERSQALAMRDAAMKTWSQKTASGDSGDEGEAVCKPKGGRGRKRRSGKDPLNYLEIKCTADAELKREELGLQKEQLELQQRQTELQMQRQEQFQLQMLHQQQQMQQQAELQQRQFAQQMQAQTQTQNLILALLQKMSGH